MTGEDEKPVSPVSPLPWREEAVGSEGRVIYSAQQRGTTPQEFREWSRKHRVATVFDGLWEDLSANAAYIVTACNAYPDLKARLVALETENRRLREALEGAKSDIRWTLSKRVDGALHPVELHDFAKVAERIECALQGDQDVTGT